MARGPKFNPQPFAGTYAPPGASPEALRELERMKRDDEAADRKAAAPSRRPQAASAPPRDEHKPGIDNGDDDDSGSEAAPSVGAEARGRPRRAGAPSGHGRPAKEDRVQRAVRLTAPLDVKLRQLAEFRGVDLNAAVSVAIVEDWRRCFGSRVDRS